MLLCLHEESAVAIAHGYAKVTGKAMAAAVHSNVGLFHATMAMFNAWCDRMPIVVLGATGPVDAAKRRPWIDWIHTARDQGAIVRNYTKWDDQPASPAATRESIIRATWMANTAPMGPVYINLDAELQEAKLTEPLPPIDVARFMPDATPAASPELVKQAAALLKGAKNPVIVVGRTSRSARRLERARRARRDAQRQGHHRPQVRLRASRPTIRCMPARRPATRSRPRRSRRSRPPTSSSRSTAIDLNGVLRGGFRLRRSEGEDHQRQRRLPRPQRLEHGLRGAAADRPAAGDDARAGRARDSSRRSAAPRRRSPLRSSRRRSRTSRAMARCGSTISRLRSSPPAATATSPSRTCRCRGTARLGISAIRSTISARTAAAALAPVPD